MPIGPLAIAILRGILPYYTTDSNTVLAARVAAHQGAEKIVIWLTFVAMLTLIPGVIALGLMARRGAPRLGTAGLVLAFAAFMCLFWSSVAGSDTVALGAARIGMQPGTTGGCCPASANSPRSGWASAVFVARPHHRPDPARHRAVARPGRARLGRAGLGVSQILHFVFAVIVPVHVLDGCSWGLTAMGFAAAAVALTREPSPSGALRRAATSA